MSKLEVEMTIGGESVVFNKAPIGGITWDYIAGYYDASGTITQGYKEGGFLETRVFIWSRDKSLLEHLRVFLARPQNKITATVEDVAKRKYPRWRLRIARRGEVIEFARVLLQHLRVREKRDALMKAMKNLETYTKKVDKDVK